MAQPCIIKFFLWHSRAYDEHHAIFQSHEEISLLIIVCDFGAQAVIKFHELFETVSLRMKYGYRELCEFQACSRKINKVDQNEAEVSGKFTDE